MAVTSLDATTALIIVDLQHGIVGYPFIHPIGEVIERSRALLDAFRERGLPVVLVNVSGFAPGRTERPRRSTELPADWADLIAQLGQQPSDILVTKRSWGAFAKAPCSQPCSDFVTVILGHSLGGFDQIQAGVDPQ